MYRRPSELAKVRYVVCIQHRAEAQRLYGVTDAQLEALSIGWYASNPRQAGYTHSEETKRKISESNKRWLLENPELLQQRGLKIRGENHYKWKGGASKLNTAIRQMTENRKWMDAVKNRDGCCTRCYSTSNLESHHVVPLSEIIETFCINSVEDARGVSILWDINNGITLCKPCHYKEHGRISSEDK